MNCDSCGSRFTDGVQCGLCKKHYDFPCAQISESGWRKLGVERRAVWKCTTCRGRASPAPATPTPDPPSLENIMKEIQALKAHLTGLPTLVEDVKSIKSEISEMKLSCEFLSGKIDDFATKLSAIEARVSSLEDLSENVSTLQSDVGMLKLQLAVNDQRSRLNNVEIKGVPEKPNENLFTVIEAIGNAVNFSIPKSQINYLYRIQVSNTKEKSIVVNFVNRYVKEDFVASARAIKTLSTADVGFKSVSRRIFVNDHLTADMKLLLNKTKLRAKEFNFSYVWVKYSKIHVRKSDSSRVFIVNKEEDLNKMV
ncbi:hypothetical protein HW555_006406 [Spodoptera exigua]|uniref:FP protein C-terminal domain-containing protein n=1 Tax=Spodoptera exigua TaxID=7107 RepID=A0A835GG54_SPOEX|nr:hypothetical protein HW555_006406 [Spodoptera exigua]